MHLCIFYHTSYLSGSPSQKSLVQPAFCGTEDGTSMRSQGVRVGDGHGPYLWTDTPQTTYCRSVPKKNLLQA